MKFSLLRSKKISYKGWTLEKFKEVFLLKNRPIPVFDPIDDNLVREEIERFFYSDSSKEQLLQEIITCVERVHNSSHKFGMMTTQGKHAIVLTDFEESPKLVFLLGIIREFAFRNTGGGTADIDLDKLDYNSSMRQLIVIDLEAVQQKNYIAMIYGSYRYKVCRTREDYLSGSVGEFFEFDESFTDEVRIELGRSLLNPIHLGKSFDPVLFGLAYLKVIYPDVVGFFGKITLTKQYEILGAVKYFLAVAKSYWRGEERSMVRPKIGLGVREGKFPLHDQKYFEKSFLRGLHVILRKLYHVPAPRILTFYDQILGLTNVSYLGAVRHRKFADSIEIGIALHGKHWKTQIRGHFIYPTEQQVQNDAK